MASSSSASRERGGGIVPGIGTGRIVAPSRRSAGDRPEFLLACLPPGANSIVGVQAWSDGPMPDERLPPTFVEAAPVTHRRAPPAAIVIFGASGDLTRRRLLPAIRRLGHQARLIRGAAVVGVGR